MTLVLSTIALCAVASAARAAPDIDVAVTQATGSAPFDPTPGPGNDTSITNDIVRSNDTITYQVQFNVNDDHSGSSVGRNVTIRQTLPAGMTWTRLPATCLTSGVTPTSSISADHQTLTCNVGDIPTGVSRTLALRANVTEMRNGTVLTPATDSVTVDADGAPTAKTTPAPVTVSSIARVDMVKQAPRVTQVDRGGVPGYLLAYPVSVQIPNFGSRGLIGYSPPAAAMTLKDDISQVSPHAEFVSCGADVGGVWTCPAAGASSPLDLGVTITHPNSIDSGALSSTTVTIFVPRSDLEATPSGALTTTNTLTDLVAKGQDGSPAVGEITSNNSAQATLYLDPAHGFAVTKGYVDVTAPGRFVPGGANVFRNGFSTVGVGQVFQGEVLVSANNPVAGYDHIGACDIFDTTTQRVSLAGAASNPAYGNGNPAWITANGVTGGPPLVAGTDVVLEYSTRATSTDPDDATRWAALRATDCGGPSTDWSTTPPADTGTITKVRLRFLTTPPRQFNLRFAVNFVALPNPNATKIANFATYETGDAWSVSSYDPSNHTGARGDRLILTAAQLTLKKDILDPVTPPTSSAAVRGGDDVEFGIRPRVVAPSQAIPPTTVTARDVTVTDVLPAGTSLSTVAGHEPSPAPTSKVVNPDGTTTLTWSLGQLTNADTPSITYWATVARTVSGSRVNRAIVTSPDDVGSPTSIPTSDSSDPHVAARTIVIDSLGGIQIDKTVDKPVIEPHDDMTFSVSYANLDLTSVDGMDVIDVLPFHGDGEAIGDVPGRAPGSDFHGSYALRSVDVSDGETVRYADADPASIYEQYDPAAAGGPVYGTLPAGKQWCTAAQIAASGAGCPSSIGTATALRVTRDGSFAGGAVRTFSYTLRTSGNRSGDVYANTAALRSGSLTLGTYSPTRTVHVVANRIGDVVWNDLNANGRQDEGEPGVGGVKVTLDGVDKHGDAVHVTTTTDANGKYLFTSGTQADQDAGVLDLVSGTYHVTFDPATLPPRASFTTQHADGTTAENDSDASVSTGRTGDITLPDPTPTGIDGENLTLDAGIVIAPAPPVVTTPTTPTPTTPPTTPTTPTTPTSPPVLTPKLTLKKTANHAKVKAGATITYTLTARNVGQGDATNVKLCDDLPDHLTLVSKQARLARTKAKLAAGQLCWTIGTLKAGAKVVRTFVVRVDSDAPTGTIVNHATVDRTNVQGIDAKAKRAVKVEKAAVKSARGSGGVTG